jgi:hypothetical protein
MMWPKLFEAMGGVCVCDCEVNHDTDVTCTSSDKEFTFAFGIICAECFEAIDIVDLVKRDLARVREEL